MLLSIKEASDLLGVSIPTLRKWEKLGKIRSERTEGGHRRYDKNEIIAIRNRHDNIKITIGYCRVSTIDEIKALDKQIGILTNYCVANGYQFRIISDIGSSIDFQKKGLKELIELVCNKEINRIVINYEDRLLCYGLDMFIQVCHLHGVKIEIVNHSKHSDYKTELIQDTLKVIVDTASELYGKRSYRLKKIKEQSKNFFND